MEIRLAAAPRAAPAIARPLVCAVVAVIGCSSPADPEPTPAELHAFATVNNLLATSLTIGGVTRWAYVDTGNPETALDLVQFIDDRNFPSGGGPVASAVIGDVTEQNMLVSDSPFADVVGDPELPLFGNIGCTTLCGHVAAFDYSASSFTLDPAAPPSAAVGAAIDIPFTLAGNAGNASPTLPPSRALVQVSVEGTAYTMMIDTGATYVTLSNAAFTALTSDGRVTTPDMMGLANGSTASGLLARATTVSIGGAVVDGAVVSHSDDFDALLAAISSDAGQTVDGSLGGTFLRDFYVTVDYPAQTLHLAPYVDTSFTLDLGSSIAIRFGAPAGGGFPVTAVSGAAQSAGVTVGDIVTHIDDLTLSDVGFFEATGALYGPAGETRDLAFGKAAESQIDGHTVAIAIEAQLLQ